MSGSRRRARTATLAAVAAVSFWIAGCVATTPAGMASADVEAAEDPLYIYVEEDESTAELMIDEYLRKNEAWRSRYSNTRKSPTTYTFDSISPTKTHPNSLSWSIRWRAPPTTTAWPRSG